MTRNHASHLKKLDATGSHVILCGSSMFKVRARRGLPFKASPTFRLQTDTAAVRPTPPDASVVVVALVQSSQRPPQQLQNLGRLRHGLRSSTGK